jgi:hypothetical protein
MRLAEQRDPMIIVQERQDRTCAGCRDLDRDHTPGFRKYTCRKGRQKAQQDVFNMNRCTKYRTGDR